MLHRRTPFRGRRGTRNTFKSFVLGVLVLLMVGAVGSALWYLSRLQSVTITEVSVRGAETISEQDIESAVNRVLSGTYLGLIPHRFALLYPEEKIKQTLSSMPRVARVAIERDNTALIVTITERKSQLLWCEEANQSDCYFVDRAGIAYEKAPQLSGSAFMRIQTEGVVPKVGEALLSADIRELLLGFAYTIGEKHGFKVTRILYLKNKDATLYLMGGSTVLISSGEDLNATYANLASILSSKEFSHLRPGGFEYIDLRFGHKVFVQEKSPAASLTASTTPDVPVE